MVSMTMVAVTTVTVCVCLHECEAANSSHTSYQAEHLYEDYFAKLLELVNYDLTTGDVSEHACRKAEKHTVQYFV